MIALFEKRFYSACTTVQNLESINGNLLKQVFGAIAYHFCTGYYSKLEELTQEQCIKVFRFYYSLAITQQDSKQTEQLLSYVQHTFDYVCKSTVVTDKKEFILELFAQMKTETKVLLFCYALCGEKTEQINIMNHYNCFSFTNQELSNNLFLNVLRKVISETIVDVPHEKEDSEPVSEDYSHELFHETIHRMFHQ